jgi:hypothetical protein
MMYREARPEGNPRYSSVAKVEWESIRHQDALAAMFFLARIKQVATAQDPFMEAASDLDPGSRGIHLYVYIYGHYCMFYTIVPGTQPGIQDIVALAFGRFEIFRGSRLSTWDGRKSVRALIGGQSRISRARCSATVATRRISDAAERDPSGLGYQRRPADCTAFSLPGDLAYSPLSPEGEYQRGGHTAE